MASGHQAGFYTSGSDLPRLGLASEVTDGSVPLPTAWRLPMRVPLEITFGKSPAAHYSQAVKLAP
jgi:hypothetical protein